MVEEMLQNIAEADASSSNILLDAIVSQDAQQILTKRFLFLKLYMMGIAHQNNCGWPNGAFRREMN